MERLLAPYSLPRMKISVALLDCRVAKSCTFARTSNGYYVKITGNCDSEVLVFKNFPPNLGPTTLNYTMLS